MLVLAKRVTGSLCATGSFCVKGLLGFLGAAVREFSDAICEFVCDVVLVGARELWITRSLIMVSG